MGDEPLMLIPLAGGEAVFVLGAEDDPDTVENVDVEVTLADGSRWSATMLSLPEIGRIMDCWAITGEGLAGRFFQCSDLVIVRERGVTAMTAVLDGLIESGELRSTLAPLDPD